MNRKSMNKKKIGYLLMIIAVTIPLIGLTIMMKPFFSSEKKEYENFIETEEQSELTEKQLAAERYNQKLLAGTSVIDPFVSISYKAFYEGFSEDQAFAYLSIPALDLLYPIRLGADEYHLSLGVAHVDGTALPVGGKSTRSVLAAHRGLWNGEQGFLYINLLEKGDIIRIDNGNEILTYRMVNSEVIEPNQGDKLLAVENRDMVTLLTCHPYPVSTQRLLVNFERIAEDTKQAPAKLSADNNPVSDKQKSAELSADNNPVSSEQKSTELSADNNPVSSEQKAAEISADKNSVSSEKKAAVANFLSTADVTSRMKTVKLILYSAIIILAVVLIILITKFIKLLRP
jgi:sortase A